MTFNKVFVLIFVLEFEPFDDTLAQQADELFHSMTDRLVQLTQLRKTVLHEIESISETTMKREEEHREMILQGLQKLTERKGQMNAAEMVEEFERNVTSMGLGNVLPEQLEGLAERMANTQKELPEILNKLEKAQNLLDDLNVDQYLNQDDMLNDDMQNGRVMETSGSSIPIENLTPKTARSGLLLQLKK